MKGYSIFVALPIILLIGCGDIPKPRSEDSSAGIWRQIGYGHVIEVMDSTVRVYDELADFCLSSEEIPLLDFGEIIGASNDTLYVRHGIDTWLFNRLQELPTNCQDSILNPLNPGLNFGVFWNTFAEHYAFFSEREVDWEQLGKEYTQKIDSSTSATKLYEYLSGIIAEIDDGHVSLAAPDSIVAGAIDEENKNGQKYGTLERFEISRAIAAAYVDSLTEYNAGMIRYGKIGDSTGYLQLNAMLMLADYAVPRNIGLREFYENYWAIAADRPSELQRRDEVAGLRKIFRRILADFSGTDRLVLDLRFNGGGKDGVAVEVMNQLLKEKQLLFTKRAKHGDEFVNVQPITAGGVTPGYAGRVYLLTSELTASAAEVLVLATVGKQQFARIGGTTEGIFSSTLDKKLPNGWTFELSNELYLDTNGNAYEGRGIEPHHRIKYPPGADALYDFLLKESEEDGPMNLVRLLR